MVDLNVVRDVLQQREPFYSASAAEAAGCTHIVTRNVADFANSPVQALTPEELLAALAVV